MINRFLMAKHWQLFLLVFGIPMICQFILMGTILSSITLEDDQNVGVILNYFKIFPLLMLLFIGVLFGWYWSVAIGLDDKIPDDLKLNLGRFKLFLIIPIIYIFIFVAFVGTIMSGITLLGNEPNFAMLGLIIPIHLFSMFCIYYCLYFVAKTIKTAEVQKEVRFGDFAGEFFLIWFFPIGIWFIQPRINKLMKEEFL